MKKKGKGKKGRREEKKFFINSLHSTNSSHSAVDSAVDSADSADSGFYAFCVRIQEIFNEVRLGKILQPYRIKTLLLISDRNAVCTLTNQKDDSSGAQI